jgi:hypothetical protein
MAQNPSTTNSSAEVVDSAISDALNAAQSVAETAIIADFPFLGLPVVKTLFEIIFSYIVGKLTNALQTAGTFAVIDTQVASEEKALAVNTAAIRAAEATGDPNAIAQARANEDAAAANLLHDDGSAQ